MKISLYFNYSARSLFREGQRTLLAIFCIAVGIMAIVALQLVGLMLLSALPSSTRDANRGDINVSTERRSTILKQSDLNFFAQLKHNGTISAYTQLITTNGVFSNAVLFQQNFNLEAVDPHTFPVVTPPTFTTPTNGTLPTLLKQNQAVVSQTFIDTYGIRVGATIDVHSFTASGANCAGIDCSTNLHVKIVGIFSNSDVFAQSGSVMLVSIADYQAAAPHFPLPYDEADIATVDQAHTDKAVHAIHQQLPLATTQTATALLKQNQAQQDQIAKYVEMAGLLALLIGGVGIVNTMHVLLLRRKTEIAMLKTTGYRRLDLYLLFGLETGLLGFIGGVIGSGAAIGLSYPVRNLVQQTIMSHVPFSLDWPTIAGGVAIGMLTALIFGLMPIVQAANIRPLQVMRELPEGKRLSSIFSTLGLLLLLSVLFCLLAIYILKDVVLGIGTVYGTFVFLALLSIVLGLVNLAVGALPVPERFNARQLALVAFGLALAAALYYLVQPALGMLCFAVSLLGIAVVMVPRSWKVSIKMALRNLGRQRARTTTTMLALFVGIYAIGLILTLSQDLRNEINALTQDFFFNVQAVSTGNETKALDAGLKTLPGLSVSQQAIYAKTEPVSINGISITTLLPTESKGLASPTSIGNASALDHLSEVTGYDVTDPQFLVSHNFHINAGRSLNASDVGTDHVIIHTDLVQSGPLHIKIGDRITLVSTEGTEKHTRTVIVVGTYAKTVTNIFGDILAPTATALTLASADQVSTVHYLRIDPNTLNTALKTIERIAPHAFVVNTGDFSASINRLLNNIVLVLTTIASLAMLAGVITMANAVALTMLERRRELGILKAVGYTSRTVLGEVLIEYGTVGAIGALLAMLLIIATTSLLGRLLFQGTVNVSVNGASLIGLIVGSMLLAMFIAALVAWKPVHTRPLEVLRYD